MAVSPEMTVSPESASPEIPRLFPVACTVGTRLTGWGITSRRFTVRP